ncbi:aromatic-ring-hydroxylating dioxygenase subunit beta [Extensimonas vulgaris]|uniref:Benzoate/toluate 1,2-dioxygenase beta subunit/anthranilate 1,2-dioxygenase (Deaminating, decarboxylating) small subunit n=1 Tax=Extensimonas vulgaris TaxID=1031594 RepID=A0A369AND0_9BURK|nr:aromatic-ring-hydroxylating dioxygenase subunit beta [Extensimonas vulgaris]RCX10671.1 benzoate/toluate 1,2-dioxygenase beta subunit/anthranilate 1,2-dioxygenase (deaminating, decarboxylating) small subunit [Extensimonas vulgaris]TWI41313.1 benzoate/toluate 1,2-dioxygenase beta subunit/anthranilate 1,2-dioxygenase (deaminating, decarboxylating) small subunit [Extensimonas vulgaris]
MSTNKNTLESKNTMNATDLQQSVSAFLYREAECVDERRWDDWLALFDAQAEYWIPSWDSEYELVSNPQSEVSLMYYPSRAGLEDRVFRLRTGRSAASTPLPRTCHTVSNVRPVLQADGSCSVKANFLTHLFRNDATQLFYGHYEYLLTPHEGSWLIRKKKVIVLNDLIDTVLDIYSV